MTKKTLCVFIDEMLNSEEKNPELIKLLEDKVAVYPVVNKTIEPIIVKYIKLAGKNCSLNWIDTSRVTNMSCLFDNTWKGFNYPKFDGDISKWNVSKVKTMYAMFKNSIFDGDISNWNVSSVEDMSYMFYNSDFNGDISEWDIHNVKSMYETFYNAKSFNQDISNWDVSSVRDSQNEMFYNCPIREKYKPDFVR